MKNLRRSRLNLALALLASAILFSLSSQSWAIVVPASSGFGFKIDQNLITLDNSANITNLEAAIADGATGLEDSLNFAKNTNLTMAVMCMPYTSILALRETPGISLSNNVDSEWNIIGMELKLGNISNQFMEFNGGGYYQENYSSGEYTYINLNTYQNWRVDPDLVPSSAGVQDNATRFVMSFGNGGMKPGRATTFKIKTSKGMLLHEFFDESTTLDITYQNPITNETYSTGPELLNEIDEFNDGLVDQIMTGTKNGRHFSEMVDPYRLGIVIIPEPANLALVLCGVSCLVLRRWRVTQFT